MNTSDQTLGNVSDSGATLRREFALIRKNELAKELSVSPRQIDNWGRKRLIPVHRFSSRLVRYDLRRVRNALDKFEAGEIRDFQRSRTLFHRVMTTKSNQTQQNIRPVNKPNI